jgi:hypothetical protein
MTPTLLLLLLLLLALPGSCGTPPPPGPCVRLLSAARQPFTRSATGGAPTTAVRTPPLQPSAEADGIRILYVIRSFPNHYNTALKHQHDTWMRYLHPQLDQVLVASLAKNHAPITWANLDVNTPVGRRAGMTGLLVPARRLSLLTPELTPLPSPRPARNAQTTTGRGSAAKRRMRC